MSCTAKVWKVRGPLIGNITKDDFVFKEEKLPALRDGDRSRAVINNSLAPEFQAETLFLSVDPYMKLFGAQQKSGEVVASIFQLFNQVARVTQSKNAKFPVGSIVVNSQGWRSHFNSNGDNVEIVPDFGGLAISPSHVLGALGMPGLTSYCAVIDVCQAKPGEVLVVNAAAGAVGYIIVQIAKALGCKVIAYAGTDGKCKWLKELGADYAFNYKETDLAATLDQAAPDGIDCFIDHVGGHTLSTILKKVRMFGRVCILGAISQYNKKPEERDKCEFDSYSVPILEVTIRGFGISNHLNRKSEVIPKLLQWNKEGIVKFRESIVQGFEKMPDALLSLFTATEQNYGKVIVKV